ncbi:MAG TPA: YbhB/YbcL family Raf kinase inhibitor-like protein [Gaiellaceae bacterium]|nr:YbhB/YbcL family Raf kinase inhibitor-like protein [Gaiellaceae bacterium]
MTKFELSSDAFDDDGLLPDAYERVSPPLRWTDPPPGTRSLALVVERQPKLHAPWDETLTEEPVTYWLVWGLPPHAGSLDAGVSLLREGLSSSGRFGYAPTRPPAYKRRVLLFRMLALSSELTLARGATRAEFMQATLGLVLAEAELEVRWDPGRPRWYERLGRLLR